jgi:hypothetical protein
MSTLTGSRTAEFSFQFDRREWMKKICLAIVLALGLTVVAIVSFAQAKRPAVVNMRLDSLHGLEVVGGTAVITAYKGRRALHMSPLPDHHAIDDSILAIVTATDFKNGTIQVDVSGAPRPDAPADERGFIGVLFRAQDHGARAENLYLRPTNGRADDQLRRNHSVEYESVPDFPWYRLRKENPGVYESYADMEAGAWTKLKIVVSGTKARLYINGADQPCLIVNDLKLGETHGQIVLWAHWSTDAYFSNLTVTPI